MKIWKWFLARFRISLSAVCEMSKSCGLNDYHDYPDSECDYPDYFIIHKCKRCGKVFVI